MIMKTDVRIQLISRVRTNYCQVIAREPMFGRHKFQWGIDAIAQDYLSNHQRKVQYRKRMASGRLERHASSEGLESLSDQTSLNGALTYDSEDFEATDNELSETILTVIKSDHLSAFSTIDNCSRPFKRKICLSSHPLGQHILMTSNPS